MTLDPGGAVCFSSVSRWAFPSTLSVDLILIPPEPTGVLSLRSAGASPRYIQHLWTPYLSGIFKSGTQSCRKPTRSKIHQGQGPGLKHQVEYARLGAQMPRGVTKPPDSCSLSLHSSDYKRDIRTSWLSMRLPAAPGPPQATICLFSWSFISLHLVYFSAMSCAAWRFKALLVPKGIGDRR